MTVPEPPPQPPPTSTPARHRRRRRLWARLLGRRRAVTVTEPTGWIRRQLQRLAVPLLAVAIVAALLAVLLVYQYINHRIGTLEGDRAARKHATDQTLSRVDAELRQARADNDQLRLALCSVINTVPPHRSAFLDLARTKLRCGPYVAPAATTPAAAPATSPAAPGPASTAVPSPSATVAAAGPPTPSPGTSRPPSPSSATPSGSPSSSATCVLLTPLGSLCLP